MEIKTWLFFSFWATVSIVFLKLGFNAFETTNLSHKVSPLVLFFFSHAAAISVCYSSHYTFVYSPQLDIPDVRQRYHLFLVFALTGPLIYNAIDGPGMWYYFPMWGYVFFLYFIVLFFYGVPGDEIGFGVDFTIKMLLIYFGDNKKLVPILVLLVSWYTSTVWAEISEAQGTQRTPPWMLDDVPVNILTPTIKKMDKLVKFGAAILRGIVFQDENSSILRRMIQKRRPLIEFAVGMVGTVLFQNFFKLTTFNHVVAFLYFAVVWLANLALLRPASDLGVFNFLLANVVVGCTVSEFGFQGTTLIANGASVLLYGLRVELQSLTIVNRGEAEPRVMVW
ncbi:thioredoxin family protein [Dorcoceras hygrometricum]|uniref:Thioredoxin family protein n=1 Tax=Dorcoceras hygrometricum TaxID=472368 RepID=A0A2Z7AAW1_9LAMI|nr:thioredoxin family protein [Dorcoceras hygrometricum]